jgi:hypothetical protein
VLIFYVKLELLRPNRWVYIASESQSPKEDAEKPHDVILPSTVARVTMFGVFHSLSAELESSAVPSAYDSLLQSKSHRHVISRAPALDVITRVPTVGKVCAKCCSDTPRASRMILLFFDSF